MENIFSYQLGLLFAGFVYIVTPGPVFLAIISLVSDKGKSIGFRFVAGAIFGCMVWLTFTCASLIEADKLPDELFILLALACASYLFFLGGKMLARSVKNERKVIFEKPFIDGFMLALLNPKSYPVMTSVFGGIAIHYVDLMQWTNFPEIFLFSVLGFALGYAFMVLMASFKAIKKIYTNNLRIVSMCFGLIFMYFGVNLILGVLPKIIAM
jgi:threonine/homoserine/homoserine lactone efflux protein